MWVVGVVAVLVVAAAVGAGVGFQALPLPLSPGAMDRNLRSFHVEQHDDQVGGGVDADVVLAPSLAYQLLSNGRPYQVMVSGATYGAITGSQRWVVSTANAPLPVALWWREMRGALVVGVDASGWRFHGSARGMPVDLWVTTDGCPVRATATFPAVRKSGPNHPYDVHYTYTKCNQVGPIAAPAANLRRGPGRHVTGGVGQRTALDRSALTVTSARISALPPDPSLGPPAAGRVYLVTDVRIENATATALSYSLAADGPGMFHVALTPVGAGPLTGKGTLAAGQTATGTFTIQVPATGAGFALYAVVDIDEATIQLTAPDVLSVTARIGQQVRLHTVVVTVTSVDLNAVPSTLLGDQMRPGDRIVAVKIHLQIDAPVGQRFELHAGGRAYPDSTIWAATGAATDHQVRFAVPASATGLTLVAQVGRDTLSVPLGL